MQEGAERPCILIGDPLEEACSLVHIFAARDVRDGARMHTLKLSYLSTILLSLSLSRSFSRLFFSFFFFNTSLHSRTSAVIRDSSAPCQGQPAFRGYSYSGLKVPEKMITNPGGVSYRVKFYRRHISSGDRFITGAKRDSRAKNSV